MHNRFPPRILRVSRGAKAATVRQRNPRSSLPACQLTNHLVQSAWRPVISLEPPRPRRADLRRSLYVSCMGTPCAKFYCCYLADRGLHPPYVQVSWCRHVGIARIGATRPGCRNFLTWKQGIIFVPNLEFLGLVVKDRTRVLADAWVGRWSMTFPAARKRPSRRRRLPHPAASAPVLPKGKSSGRAGLCLCYQQDRTRRAFGGRNDSGMRIADDACLTFSLARRRKTRAINSEVLRTIPPWPFMFFPFNHFAERLLSGTARKMHLFGSESDAEHVYGTDG